MSETPDAGIVNAMVQSAFSISCFLLPWPPVMQVRVGEEVRITDRTLLDARFGTCEWSTEDIVIRDIPASMELIVEVWATDFEKGPKEPKGHRGSGWGQDSFSASQLKRDPMRLLEGEPSGAAAPSNHTKTKGSHHHHHKHQHAATFVGIVQIPLLHTMKHRGAPSTSAAAAAPPGGWSTISTASAGGKTGGGPPILTGVSAAPLSLPSEMGAPSSSSGGLRAWYPLKRKMGMQVGRVY